MRSRCFTTYNRKSVDEIGTKCGTNHNFILFLTLGVHRSLFASTWENKVVPSRKDDRVLIKVFFARKNGSLRPLLGEFSRKNWARASVDRLLKIINSSGVTERPKGSGRPRSLRTSEFRKTSNLWRSSSAVTKVLCTSTKIRTKLKRRRTFHGRLLGELEITILGLKQALVRGHCHSLDNDTLF